MNKPLQPQDIDAKLAALDATLTDTERAVDTLSLPAASGDARSIEKLAAARARIEQLRGDREILERARAAAIFQAKNAADADAARKRADAKERAIGHARHLHDMANRVDVLVEEFRSIWATMPDVERALYVAMHEAGEPVSDGVIGRRNLQGHAANAMAAATLNIRPRTVSEIATVAWKELIEGEI